MLFKVVVTLIMIAIMIDINGIRKALEKIARGEERKDDADDQA